VTIDDRRRQSSHSGILFEEIEAGRHKLGLVTLDSSKNLNALDLKMFRAMAEKLSEWRTREDIACIVTHSSSEKAFCAGGDVKRLALELGGNPGSALAQNFFATEYFVDYLIHVYPKPILCWADGITMGGGIGIMNGASHRVVTERTLMAMPEIMIGFFPDVGATYFYNRLPDSLGLFLGLTAARFDGADAVAIGMADALLPASRKRSVFERLLRLDWTGDPERDRRLLSRELSRENDHLPERGSRLLGRLEEIGRIVDRRSIEEVDAAFRGWSGSDAWMKAALQGYLAGSPTSLKVTFEQFRRRKGLSLREVFLREWDMAINFCAASDAVEGIRALLIDKDRCPRWNPPTLSEVTDELVERYLSPSPARPNLLDQEIRRAAID
jgi:enoyl-CoA hydratase/carnithine racemase